MAWHGVGQCTHAWPRMHAACMSLLLYSQIDSHRCFDLTHPHACMLARSSRPARDAGLQPAPAPALLGDRRLHGASSASPGPGPHLLGQEGRWRVSCGGAAWARVQRRGRARARWAELGAQIFRRTFQSRGTGVQSLPVSDERSRHGPCCSGVEAERLVLQAWCSRFAEQ